MPADVSLQFREIDPADVPALFYVRTRTRENMYTLEELHALRITPETVAERLATSCKGWLCMHAGLVVGFCMADRSTGELWVIAVLPQHERQGIGNTLMSLAEEWLWEQGCSRAWLTTDIDTALCAYGFYRQRGWTDWKVDDGLRWMELVRPGAPSQPARRP